MSDFVTLDTTKAVFFSADSLRQLKITNSTNSTLYYKTTSDVSASSNDGNLTLGTSATFTTGQWVIPSINTRLTIEYLEGITFQDVTVTDDLVVSDDVTITDDLAVTGLATVGETLGITGVTSPAGGIVVGGATPTTAAKGITFGTGATPATLYRSAADTLTTDDAIIATGGVTSTGTLAATNAATVGTTLAVTGATTLTGGVAQTAPMTRFFSTPTVQASTDGTNATPSITVVYLSQILIPFNCTLTGAAIFNGATVGTDKWIYALFNSSGTPVANTATAGTTTSGADAFQQIAFTTTYAAKGPETYWVGLYANGTTDRFNAIPTGLLGLSQAALAGSVSTQTFGTVAAVTLPTTQTADVGPFCYVY